MLCMSSVGNLKMDKLTFVMKGEKDESLLQQKTLLNGLTKLFKRNGDLP